MSATDFQGVKFLIIIQTFFNRFLRMNFLFSVLDQMAKQTLHYSGGISLGNFDGKLLVASSSAIYSILPIPAETQIQVRLKFKRNTMKQTTCNSICFTKYWLILCSKTSNASGSVGEGKGGGGPRSRRDLSAQRPTERQVRDMFFFLAIGSNM